MIPALNRHHVLRRAMLTFFVGVFLPVSLSAQDSNDERGQPKEVINYLQRVYDESHRQYTFRDDYPGGFRQWQLAARGELRRMIGLDRILEQVGQHKPSIELEDPSDHGQYTRQKGWIETEPDVRIPFWLLKPKGRGPFPLAILPHGHDPFGHDTYAGVHRDNVHKAQLLAQDHDVAVQAAERGFLAIAPATRGLAAGGVRDVYGRHDRSDCRSQLMHCLLAGRTAIGERVWDVQRIIDWAVTLPDANAKQILMMGNSGGGMVTLYAAACDERITVAVPSSSFSTITSPTGRIYHCDCNMVPGLLEWGDLYDVAGLIAPRHLLAVNGRNDPLHEAPAIEYSAARVRIIYTAAGYPQRFQHRWGADGHRFYSKLMWPFVLKSLTER